MISRVVRYFKNAGDDKQIIEMTYPKIDVKNGFNAEKNFDHRRNKVNNELKEKARIMARDYLKAKKAKKENAQSLNEHSSAYEEVLDKVAYASLVDYSFKKNGIEVVKQPPEQKGPLPINTLSKLVGGWFADGLGSDVVGGFHKLGSEIGDEKVRVKFRFNFEKSINNEDLLIWQGKLPAPIPPPVVANKNEHLVQITEATPNRFTLSDGRSFYTFDWLKIYPDKKLGSRAEIFHRDDLKYKPQVSGAFDAVQLDELQRSYVDTRQIDSSLAWAVTGGRKSTRRRQRRSNTRRIKQRKQSRKNHTRRRKSIRK